MSGKQSQGVINQGGGVFRLLISSKRTNLFVSPEKLFVLFASVSIEFRNPCPRQPVPILVRGSASAQWEDTTKMADKSNYWGGSIPIQRHTILTKEERQKVTQIH